MPHSITHGDGCFAYFNKIRGILGEVATETSTLRAKHRASPLGLASLACFCRDERPAFFASAVP